MKNRELFAGKQVCCTCAHYHQHYGRGPRGYFEVHCGHCTALLVKTRKPDQTCKQWKERKETKSRP